MGCGESKHAVSTADTISLSKRSSSDVAKDIIVKDVESTNNVKIPQKDVVSTNESNISKSQNENKEGDSAAAAAGQVSTENVVSEKKEAAQDLKKTDDVQQTKGDASESESRVEKIKEDEIKEVAAAAAASSPPPPPPPVDAVVVVEEVAIKTAEQETKTEEAHKEDDVEADEIKEKEPEKSAEAKESTYIAEEKIPPIVEEKVDDSAKVENSANNDSKST